MITKQRQGGSQKKERGGDVRRQGREGTNAGIGEKGEAKREKGGTKKGENQKKHKEGDTAHGLRGGD